jgi:hypothetical protein
MKITKSQLKQIIKEELKAVQELYGRAGQEPDAPVERQSGRYEEERCVSCVQDINKSIKSSGYEVIMLDVVAIEPGATEPAKYQLRQLKPKVKNTSNVPPYVYEPPDGI